MHEHIFIKRGSNTLILLHGTGGDEHDLVELANKIDITASILSIRGTINENGRYRFFRRYKIGDYDLDSYEEETDHLKESLQSLAKDYSISLKNSTVIGFSNGANIALGLIQDYPKLINNYILFSPDFINPSKGFDSLKGLNIFLTIGVDDPHINMSNLQMLNYILKENEAKLEVVTDRGHHITNKKLTEAVNWYKKKL